MSRSLFSAVSGLTSFQTWMDVIGNNIANAATPGFKTSVVVFTDILNQTLSAGAAPTGNRGGINPMQMGLGVTVGSITPVFLQGSLQTTNRNTDLAIQGDGFFIVASDSNLFYTRAGAFNLDANGDLVESATGFKVQGADGDIRISLGQQGAAALTQTAQLKGNLDFLAPDGTTYPLTFTFVDSVGATHNLTVTFTKNFAAAPGQWDWEATSNDAGILNITTATGSVTFDENGAIASGDTQDIGIEFVPGSGVTSPQTITLDFGTAANNTPLTGFASASSVALSNQDGLVSGTLQSFAVGADGVDHRLLQQRDGPDPRPGAARHVQQPRRAAQGGTEPLPAERGLGRRQYRRSRRGRPRHPDTGEPGGVQCRPRERVHLDDPGADRLLGQRADHLGVE